jgi:hypothetical protein
MFGLEPIPNFEVWGSYKFIGKKAASGRASTVMLREVMLGEGSAA